MACPFCALGFARPHQQITTRQVQAQFRKASAGSHPDRPCGSDAAQRFTNDARDLCLLQLQQSGNSTCKIASGPLPPEVIGTPVFTYSSPQPSSSPPWQSESSFSAEAPRRAANASNVYTSADAPFQPPPNWTPPMRSAAFYERHSYRMIAVCCKQGVGCHGWMATETARGNDLRLQQEVRNKGWWLPSSKSKWSRVQCPVCRDDGVPPWDL